MQISSSSAFNSPLGLNSILSGRPPLIQPVNRITRGDGGLVEHTEEEQAGAHPLTLPKDTASFSSAAMQALEQEAALAQQAGSKSNPLKAGQEEVTQEAHAGAEELTDGEQEQVRKLKARDVEVRAHEAAHAAAAGALSSGGPSYDYKRGPDGANYAVGGEVGISLGTGSTPEERVANAEQAQRAANAPANPSGQDRAVAAQAAQIATSARAEISKAKQEEAQGSQPEQSSTGEAATQGAGAPAPSAGEQAGAQTMLKAEQQDARKAQVMQMARRTNAYREISEATTGSSRAV